nr:hypothetical protein [Tanacetum cinerariifolium]
MLAPDKDVPVAEGSTETTTERYMENYKNVSQDIRDQLNAEDEVVQIFLTGIDNDIYFTVDACPYACEMWKSIERLKQGESINVQDLETNLYWEFRKFTSRDGESLESYYSRLQQAATRNRGKAIVNSPLPIYDQEPSMVAEDDEMSKDKEIDKLMALISLSFKKIYKPTNNNLRTSSNTSKANQDNFPRINRGNGYDNQRKGNVVGARETVGATVVQKYGIQCYNYKEFRHVARECQKPKRTKDATYHKEKMLLCKQEEAGFQLNAEQADWRDDTDDEPEDQELEAHYTYMAQIQEVTPNAADYFGSIFDFEPLQKVSNDDNNNVFATESEHPEQSKSVNDTYSIEQDEHNVIIDSLDMSYDREQIDQDDDDDFANERDLLASLIEKLKCKIDDSKNRNKFLETSNKALVDKLKGEIEDFKHKNKSLESSNNHFKEANNELSKINKLMYKDLKKFQAELDRHNDVKYASKAQIKFHKTREDKELDKVIALENKVNVLDNIVYKIGQTVQTINMLNRNCKTSFAKPDFLKKAQRANPRLYDIGVIPPTSVSKPQLKSNQIEDRVMLNNSQGKKQEVEDHHRNVKFSKNKTSVTLVEIILFIVDSGCSKHMKRNLKLLINFVKKFLGTVKFGNDQIAPILGYGDLGNDLLTGSRSTYLYSITLQDTSSPNLICLMAKATSSQAWLWHRHLSHLNVDTINLLSKNDIVIGLPKLKFVKDHLCSSCELGKAKRKSFQTKTTPSSKRRLQLLHMDLCGPMRVESINGRKYVLLIVDDYSRYTWTHFLRSKDETPEVLIDFLRLVQRGLHAQEKGDACIFIGYSTQSRAYMVFNKRTRMIVETIHVNFDELPQMASDHVSSDPVPQSGTVTTSNELDFLFSLMFNELLNGSTQVVSKSSAETTADAPNQCQQQNTTPSNTQTTPDPTCQVSTQAPTVTSTENINQADTIEENGQVKNDEFINIFCTPVQDKRETSSRLVDSSNMHTFYQRHPSEHRWTSKVISQGEARFLVFLSAYLQHCMRTRNSLVKNKREKDKIETKPDQIKKKGKRSEVWKSQEQS